MARHVSSQIQVKRQASATGGQQAQRQPLFSGPDLSPLHVPAAPLPGAPMLNLDTPSEEAPLQFAQSGEAQSGALVTMDLLFDWAMAHHLTMRGLIAAIQSSRGFSGSDAAKEKWVQALRAQGDSALIEHELMQKEVTRQRRVARESQHAALLTQHRQELASAMGALSELSRGKGGSQGGAEDPRTLDEARAAELREIYANLHRHTVSSAEVQAAVRLSGDSHLEKEVAKAGEHPSDSQVVLSQWRAVTERQLKLYEGQAATAFSEEILEQRAKQFKKAFGRATKSLADKILDDAEALCFGYLEDMTELRHATQRIVALLDPGRKQLLALLNWSNDLEVAVGLGPKDPESNNALRVVSHGTRSKVLDFVKYVLRGFKFVLWPNFPLEEVLAETNAERLLERVCAYLKAQVYLFSAARQQLDPEMVYGLNLLLPKAKAEFQIPEGERSIFAYLIEDEQRAQKSRRRQRVESAISVALTVVSLTSPGGALAAAGALAGAGLAVDSALQAMANYEQAETMSSVGFKSKSAGPALRLIGALVNAVTAVRAAAIQWPRLVSWGKRLWATAFGRGRVPGANLPDKPQLQLTAGASAAQAEAEQLNIHAGNGLLRVRVSVQRVESREALTGGGSVYRGGKLMQMELTHLNASSTEQLEGLAEQVLRMAEKKHVTWLQITASGKNIRSFNRLIEMETTQTADVLTRGYLAASSYQKSVIASLLKEAQEAGVPAWVYIDAKIAGKFNGAMFGSAWVRAGGTQLHLEGVQIGGTPEAMSIIAERLLEQFPSVERFSFTANVGSLQTFPFGAQRSVDEISSALGQLRTLTGGH